MTKITFNNFIDTYNSVFNNTSKSVWTLVRINTFDKSYSNTEIPIEEEIYSYNSRTYKTYKKT
jgi:hypothetical protein